MILKDYDSNFEEILLKEDASTINQRNPSKLASYKTY